MDTRKNGKAASTERPPKLVRSHTDIGAPGKRWQLTNIYRGHDKYSNDREHPNKHHLQDMRSITARYPTQAVAHGLVEDASKGATGPSPSHQNVQPNRPISIPPHAARISPLFVFEKSTTWAALALEEERVSRRQDELRSGLNFLSDLAHGSTRRLDNTYYVILEKISSLRSTIRSLEELSSASSKLHDDFKTQVTELVAEANNQLGQYQNFHDQQSRVEALECRLNASRDRIKMINDRLETARSHAEEWGKREVEWQARTSKRLKILWTVSVILMTLVILWILAHRFAFGIRKARVADTVFEVLLNKSLPSLILDDLNSIVSKTASEIPRATSEAKQIVNTRLDIFDEL